MKVLLNGNLIETPLPFEASNRAFQYGDGIFETMWFIDGRVPLQTLHERRLRDGLSLLSLQLHKSRIKFLEENIESLRQFNCPDTDECIAKFMVWRKSSEIGAGYYNDTDIAETLLTIRPKPTTDNNPLRLGISEESIVSKSPWSAAKTMNSLPYIMAARECRRRVADDLLILNPAGEVAEAISSNVFAFINGEWITPELGSGCVNGVMRQFILEQSWDYPCRPASIQADSLHLASAMLLSSSTGCKPVSLLNDVEMDADFAIQFINRIHGRVCENKKP